MSDPEIAQKSPFKADLQAGQNYAWCACGKSGNQPFCDGSHKDTEFRPHVFTADKDDTVFFCGCKRSANAPFCDGSHKAL